MQLLFFKNLQPGHKCPPKFFTASHQNSSHGPPSNYFKYFLQKLNSLIALPSPPSPFHHIFTPRSVNNQPRDQHILCTTIKIHKKCLTCPRVNVLCLRHKKISHGEFINYVNDTSCLLVLSLCASEEEIHGKLFVYNYNSFNARSLPLWNCEKRFLRFLFSCKKSWNFNYTHKTPDATAKKKHQSIFKLQITFTRKT